MDFTEIKIEIASKDCETASAIANMVVPYGIYIEDYSMLEDEILEVAHIDLIDDELLKKNRQKAIIHIYISPQSSPEEAVSFLKERFLSESITFKISETGCREDDWINNWKQYFFPIPIGEKLLIRPTWRDDFDPGSRAVLNIDPGLAFGTGTHETTRLCLNALEKYVADDCTVLDVGTGSGILSVASLLLGAKSAIGVDIDPAAVKTSRENAELNDVSEQYTAICGNLTDCIAGEFNVVVANIVADAIITLSRGITRYLSDDAVFIASGIIDSRRDDVLCELETQFDIVEELNENGWICFIFKKINSNK